MPAFFGDSYEILNVAALLVLLTSWIQKIVLHPPLHRKPKEKARYVLSSGLSFTSLVAWGGIEPPTQGFSVLCSTD